MKRLITYSLILLLALNTLMIVGAEQVLEPISVGEDNAGLVIPGNTISPEAQGRINDRIQRENVFNTIIWIIAFFSMIITFFIGKLMIKINPKRTGVILHGLILIGALSLSVAQSIDWARWMSERSWQVFDAGLLVWLLPSYIGLIASAIILWKGKRYSRNMSLSIILGYLAFILISFIFELSYGVVYDLPATLGLALLIVPIGFSLYAILGIIGAIIDKRKSNLNSLVKTSK